MSVAIGKMDGVDSVTVSLNEGLADIALKPGNTLDPERIREVVRDNGFTPKSSDVEVRGRIAERDGRPVLSVSGLGVYLLVEHPEVKGRLEELDTTSTGFEATVMGRLPESAAEERPGVARTLQLREWRIVDR